MIFMIISVLAFVIGIIMCYFGVSEIIDYPMVYDNSLPWVAKMGIIMISVGTFAIIFVKFGGLQQMNEAIASLQTILH